MHINTAKHILNYLAFSFLGLPEFNEPKSTDFFGPKKALGVEQIGHRLLLARGILALEQ